MVFAMGMANNLQRNIYLEGLSWLTKERHPEVPFRNTAG
jgi:hypothetical protein